MVLDVGWRKSHLMLSALIGGFTMPLSSVSLVHSSSFHLLLITAALLRPNPYNTLHFHHTLGGSQPSTVYDGCTCVTAVGCRC